MSVFRMLVTVVKEVEWVQKNFLWGWGSKGRKIDGWRGTRYASRKKKEVYGL